MVEKVLVPGNCLIWCHHTISNIPVLTFQPWNCWLWQWGVMAGTRWSLQRLGSRNLGGRDWDIWQSGQVSDYYLNRHLVRSADYKKHLNWIVCNLFMCWSRMINMKSKTQILGVLVHLVLFSKGCVSNKNLSPTFLICYVILQQQDKNGQTWGHFLIEIVQLNWRAKDSH